MKTYHQCHIGYYRLKFVKNDKDLNDDENEKDNNDDYNWAGDKKQMNCYRHAYHILYEI